MGRSANARKIYKQPDFQRAFRRGQSDFDNGKSAYSIPYSDLEMVKWWTLGFERARLKKQNARKLNILMKVHE